MRFFSKSPEKVINFNQNSDIKIMCQIGERFQDMKSGMKVSIVKMRSILRNSLIE